MSTTKPRFSISLDDEIFNQVEDFRFINRCQTRSEAISALIKIGLESLKESDSKNKKEKIHVKI